MSDWKHRLKREQLTIEEILMQIEFVLQRIEEGNVQKGKNALTYLYLELKERK